MKFVKLAAFFLAVGCTQPTPELKTYGALLPTCLLFCRANVSTAEADTGNATGVISSEPPAVSVNAP